MHLSCPVTIRQAYLIRCRPCFVTWYILQTRIQLLSNEEPGVWSSVVQGLSICLSEFASFPKRFFSGCNLYFDVLKVIVDGQFSVQYTSHFFL